MIDFNKILKPQKQRNPTSLLELFEQLDRKATHQILRPVQSEALQMLNDLKGQKDLVIKLSTGSGKTVIGLIYADMMRRTYPGELVMYLCPTLQLVSQVCETAEKIGVPVMRAVSGETPHSAYEGKSLLVCTYDKLFTAKNIFDKDRITPAAIIFDDIHAGVEKVRQKYSFVVPEELYLTVRNLFRGVCEYSDPATWRGIYAKDPTFKFEVPYWIWSEHQQKVAELIEGLDENQDVILTWPNVVRNIALSRLCISGQSIEISLYLSDVDSNNAYSNARNRLYMSASIKDGASLLREMNCLPQSVIKIVEPPSDRGVGERMILASSLIDPKIKKQDIAFLASELAKDTNVVVLTSSNAQAEIWRDLGATIAQGEDVSASIESLKSADKGGFIVFTQRFDGLDLPDDACRVLIVDGVPVGSKLSDQLDFDRQHDSPVNEMRVLNKLEQALGRSVRSSADFSAVILVGSDLATFLGKKSVKELLEPDTGEQIELGKQIAEQLRDGDDDSVLAIKNAVNILLSRNEDWKSTHRDRLSEIKRRKRDENVLNLSERVACSEREAFKLGRAGKFEKSAATLQDLLDKEDISLTQKAELLNLMAAYTNHYDIVTAKKLSQSAFHLNTYLFKPIELVDKKIIIPRAQSIAIGEAFNQYSELNGLVAQLELLRSRLAYLGDADKVEQALYELGRFLGASSSRPEKETGRGPDVLWHFEDCAYCIEAKNEKTSKIFKSDAGQLLLSRQWCVSELGLKENQIISTFATNIIKPDRKEDLSFSPYFIKESTAISIIDSLIVVAKASTLNGPLFADVSRLSQLINQQGLSSSKIKNKFEKS